MTLDFRPVESFEDAISMRVLRNQCREFMTNDTSYLTVSTQRVWFSNIYWPEYKKGNLRAYLGRGLFLDEAYGLCRVGVGVVWLSGGVAEEVRGQGYGRQLFTFLVEQSREHWPEREVWLDVKAENTAACNLYRSLGFQEIEYNSMKNILVMRLPN
jgi:ribosomal protein S18 acetylase RimI-like enzyme